MNSNNRNNDADFKLEDASNRWRRPLLDWLMLITIAGALLGQENAPIDSRTLEDRLASHFGLIAAAGKHGVKGQGSPLILNLNGLVAVLITPWASFHDFYRAGRFKQSVPTFMTAGNPHYRSFGRGERWIPTKLEVKKDEVYLEVVTAEIQDVGYFKTIVVFQVEKKHVLTLADFDRVLAATREVFTPEEIIQPTAEPTPVTVTPPIIEPPPPPEPPPDLPSKAIKVGNTTGQVIATLGQPGKIIKFGSKEIYFYKSIKITFINGKVSDL